MRLLLCSHFVLLLHICCWKLLVGPVGFIFVMLFLLVILILALLGVHGTKAMESNALFYQGMLLVIVMGIVTCVLIYAGAAVNDASGQYEAV